MVDVQFDKIWVFVALLTVLLSYIVLKTINSLQYWKKRGVAHLKPWPFVGNFGSLVFKRRNFAYLIMDFYKAFPNKRYFGILQMGLPTLVVSDLDLIKRMTVKDFDHFVDHITVLNTDIEPLFQKNLFLLRGQSWKNMRATLSPTFTGNKIRSMFVLMLECVKQFNDFFLEKDDDIVEVELKELLGRYTNDVIASCAFGMGCNSIRNKEDPFYNTALNVVNGSSAVWIRSLIQIVAPKLAKIFQIRLFPKSVTGFFEDAIVETIHTRKEKNIIRPDMIYLLMEAMKGKHVEENHTKHVDAGFAAVENVFEEETKTKPIENKAELTIDDIIAQAFLFFIAGAETVSVLISHCLYELVVNPDAQEKLREEVDGEFEKAKGGDLSYEAVMNMKYLDAVISETLRKWPPAVILNRECVKDFLIEADETREEKAFVVEKGISILVPVFGIQRDPKYYPNPDKFDPDRFSDENKKDILPYAYLPFGIGPRNCIGSRFALVEAKIIVAYVVSKFDLVAIKKTAIPLTLSNAKGSPVPKEFWVGLKKRKNI